MFERPRKMRTIEEAMDFLKHPQPDSAVQDRLSKLLIRDLLKRKLLRYDRMYDRWYFEFYFWSKLDIEY